MLHVSWKAEDGCATALAYYESQWVEVQALLLLIQHFSPQLGQARLSAAPESVGLDLQQKAASNSMGLDLDSEGGSIIQEYYKVFIHSFIHYKVEYCYIYTVYI